MPLQITGLSTSAPRSLPIMMTRTHDISKNHINNPLSLASIDYFIGQEPAFEKESSDRNIPAPMIYAGEAFAHGFKNIFNAPADFVEEVALRAKMPTTRGWESLNNALQIGAKILCIPITLPLGIIFGTGSSIVAIAHI